MQLAKPIAVAILLLVGARLPGPGSFQSGNGPEGFRTRRALLLARCEEPCARNDDLVPCRSRIGGAAAVGRFPECTPIYGRLGRA